MSPLTPYSPGLPVFQPGGGAWAREVGKGPLMSTSKSSKAKSGLMVSIVILFTPPHHPRCPDQLLCWNAT